MGPVCYDGIILYTMEEPMYQIPVMFDMSGASVASRADAARLLTEALAEASLTHRMPDSSADLRPPIESWWMIDGADKHADRNDNDHGVVDFGTAYPNHPSPVAILRSLYHASREGNADLDFVVGTLDDLPEIFAALGMPISEED